VLTITLRLMEMTEYNQKCLNRIQSIEARFGVGVGVREYDLEYGSTAGVREYGWSTGVLSKALQYQNIQMTIYSGCVPKFFPAISISIIIQF